MTPTPDENNINDAADNAEPTPEPGAQPAADTQTPPAPKGEPDVFARPVKAAPAAHRPEPAPSGPNASRAIPKSAASEVFDWLETLTVVMACVVLFFTFFFRIVTVDGESMEHTLENKDQLIITNLFYTPTDGDIVVIHVPNFVETAPLIKRVIATGGQTVDIDYSTWTVTVDGKALDEPYVNKVDAEMISESNLTFPLTVPEGYVFIMGDNRNNSTDSRTFGPVDARYVYGHVLFRFFPFDRLGPV